MEVRCPGFPYCPFVIHDSAMSTSAPVPLLRALADIRHELLTSVEAKAPDEKLLIELAAEGAALAFKLGVATDQMTQLMSTVLADPKKAVSVARVLHDLVALQNALTRRVEGTLSTAAALRLQRRVRRGVAE